MNQRKNQGILLGLVLIFIFVFTISFAIGRYPMAIGDVFKTFANKLALADFMVDETVENIIMNVRRPRILAGVLIGAALASSGAVFQALFRNPMASPDLLGASSGAGFGAALAILFFLPAYQISILSFLFGLGAVALTYLVSSVSRMERTLSLVLGGVMVGSIFNSLLSMAKLLADPADTLPSITYWLMGSLSTLNDKDLAFIVGPIGLGLVLIYLLRWRLNLLTMGEEEALAMGVNIKALRLVMILAASLLTAASVSVSGMIGWVGLVIPHFARLILGSDYKYVIPASILMGASYLLIIDNVARSLTTMEIPLGILTALVGAPFFIFLLIRRSD